MNSQQILNSYLTWIKDNTMVKTIAEGKVCAVTTPFLDRHNDHIEIYLEKKEGGYHLTDDGFTLADLKMSGFEVNSPKREKILKTVLNGFGVKKNERNELFIEANPQNIGQKKHYLLQAILSVNDMFVLAQETVYSLFKEDVELFFKANELIFTKDIKISGKSGFDHNIDFLFPSIKEKPEKLVKALNSPKKDSVLSCIMAFNDISQSRDTPAQNYVIYNDQDKTVSNDVVEALSNYSIRHIPWSKKEDCLKEFSF